MRELVLVEGDELVGGMQACVETRIHLGNLQHLVGKVWVGVGGGGQGGRDELVGGMQVRVQMRIHLEG